MHLEMNAFVNKDPLKKNRDQVILHHDKYFIFIRNDIGKKM